MNIQRPKGTLDILPKDAVKRRHIEDKLRKFSALYNYREIRTPSFEKTELFKRTIGEETDIVSKEMYSFNKDEFTLKPEMTAPVIRSYIENSLFHESPLQKLYYISNMYRHERPQAGRFREFTQYGVEAIGSSDYSVDAELITLGANMLTEFGVHNVKIKINTIGSLEERVKYLEELKNYLSKYRNELSYDSQNRFENNPLRILDTKDKKDLEILSHSPVLYDYLLHETKNHFEKVLNALTISDIKFEIDYKLVRGFDYYTSTTFEVLSEDLGAQNAVFGGGRYDMLVSQLGGNQTPAIGFACGIERLLMILEKNKYEFPEDERLILYIVTMGDEAKIFALKLLNHLRSNGIKCETDFLNRSVKSQMKEANKINAKYSIVIGENEIKSQNVHLKSLDDGNEIEISFEKLFDNNVTSNIFI